MTFIPLATISAKPVNEQLRAAQGRHRLAIDCIGEHPLPGLLFTPGMSIAHDGPCVESNQPTSHPATAEYDPKFERAFLYALGNCLIADTIEEARSLAYSPERHKVVSLDGTVFNRAGLITGGLSRHVHRASTPAGLLAQLEGPQGHRTPPARPHAATQHGFSDMLNSTSYGSTRRDAQSRAGRWDDRAVGQLRDKRDALAAQLDALQSERALAEEQQGLESDVRKMEEQRTGAVAELRATEERLGSMAQESKALTASRKSLVPELQQVRKLLVETEKKIETLRWAPRHIPLSFLLSRSLPRLSSPLDLFPVRSLGRRS